MATLLCPFCGRPQPQSEASFCSFCGCPLSAPSQANGTEFPRPAPGVHAYAPPQAAAAKTNQRLVIGLSAFGGAMLALVVVLMVVLAHGPFSVGSSSHCNGQPAPQSGQIVTYHSPNAGHVGYGPGEITAGPDGNLWFTEQEGSAIGRITPCGAITEFTTSYSGGADGIVTGPDHNLWFMENSGSIGRITPDGTFTQFSAPSSSGLDNAITSGPDGNLWFTLTLANDIGRISPQGAVTLFSVPTPNSHPEGITAGPDGNLWFVENLAGRVGRVTLQGQFNEFSLPDAQSCPQRITAGPDGNLWFTEDSPVESGCTGNHIGRITRQGVITEYSIPTLSNETGFSADPGATEITVGPDGNLWYVSWYGDQLGRITTSGSFQVYSTNSQLQGITAGPDGNLWFTAPLDQTVNRFSP